MNNLTAGQRKLAYFIAMIVLLIPIGILGMPSTKKAGSGGVIAKMRIKNRLGETTLGKVDPSSSTMNLILLGFRGIATNQLWMEAMDNKKKKNWAKLKSTVDSIILLQPHYERIWDFQGWNLAFNVSAECDGVADRYYWVKEGGKFINRGTQRNVTSPDLKHQMGALYSRKIGQSDEKKQFREFFLADPDVEQFKGGPDPDFNPEQKDNFLVARDWFIQPVEAERSRRQRTMMRMLFLSWPSLSLMEYARALQDDGIFEERAVQAWEDAYDAWQNEFGRLPIHTSDGDIFLAATQEDMEKWATERNLEIKDVENELNFLRKTANYLFWLRLANAMREPESMAAHRDIYDGKRLFREGRISPSLWQVSKETCEKVEELELTEQERKVVDFICQAGKEVPTRDIDKGIEDLAGNDLNSALVNLKKKGVLRYVSEALVKLESGLQKYEEMFKRHEKDKFHEEDDPIENGLVAFTYYKAIFQLNDEPMPDDFPLKEIVDKNLSRLGAAQETFRYETGSR